MKKVLVLGGTGMLGHMVATELSRDPELDVMATFRTSDPLPGGIAWKYFDAADRLLQMGEGKLVAYNME